jgi:hypothetical protein
MKLIVAIALLTPVVMAGGWLGGQYLMLDKRPAAMRWVGPAHGAGGLIGVVMMVLALRGAPPSLHAVRMGVAGFGLVSGLLIGAAFLAGVLILATHLRRREISNTLVATHGMLAITGYTLLVTYLTMLR